MQTGQENLHVTRQDKTKKKERNLEGSWACRRELWKRKSIHTLGSSLRDKMIIWDRMGASEPQSTVQKPVCRGQSRVRPVKMVGLDTQHFPAWDACPLGQSGSGCWGLSFGGQNWAEDCTWLRGDSLTELGGGAPHRGSTGRRLGPPQRKVPLLWGAQGKRRDRHSSFFLCMCSQATGHHLYKLWYGHEPSLPSPKATEIKTKNKQTGNFPSGSVAKTPRSQGRGPRFDLWSRN